MPHIFFERLERRISTQSFLGNIPTNGLSGSSSYASSAQSGIADPYGFTPSTQRLRLPPGIITCYLLPPCYLWPPDGGLYGGLYGGFEPRFFSPIFELLKQPIPWYFTDLSFKQPIWEIPWSLATEQSWWQLPWFIPLSEYPSWYYLNNLNSPIQKFRQTPLNYSPSWNSTDNWTSPITNHPQAPSFPIYPWNTNMDKLSKLNNVRKDLLAFFRKKGVFNDKQRQRLLSIPFDKA